MNKKQILLTGLIIIVLSILLVGLTMRYHSHLILTGATNIEKTTTPTNQTSTLVISTSSTPQIPAWGQYDINVPNTLILVDSQGRRTGEDPSTGTSYHEIPNTAYGVVESTPGHPVGELTFSNLPKGQYTLYVLGGQTGPYSLDIANNAGQQPFQGNIQSGSMVAYTQNYDSTNLASSTFSFEDTSSSTASITSAPPDNLPPPTVP